MKGNMKNDRNSSAEEQHTEDSAARTEGIAKFDESLDISSPFTQISADPTECLNLFESTIKFLQVGSSPGLALWSPITSAEGGHYALLSYNDLVGSALVGTTNKRTRPEAELVSPIVVDKPQGSKGSSAEKSRRK